MNSSLLELANAMRAFGESAARAELSMAAFARMLGAARDDGILSADILMEDVLDAEYIG